MSLDMGGSTTALTWMNWTIESGQYTIKFDCCKLGGRGMRIASVNLKFDIAGCIKKIIIKTQKICSQT